LIVAGPQIYVFVVSNRAKAKLQIRHTFKGMQAGRAEQGRCAVARHAVAVIGQKVGARTALTVGDLCRAHRAVRSDGAFLAASGAPFGLVSVKRAGSVAVGRQKVIRARHACSIGRRAPYCRIQSRRRSR